MNVAKIRELKDANRDSLRTVRPDAFFLLKLQDFIYDLFFFHMFYILACKIFFFLLFLVEKMHSSITIGLHHKCKFFKKQIKTDSPRIKPFLYRLIAPRNCREQFTLLYIHTDIEVWY